MFTINPQSKLHWPAEIFTRQDPSCKISKNLHLMKITHYTVAVAVDVIDRRGPSNEMRCQLQPKKTKVRLY